MNVIKTDGTVFPGGESISFKAEFSQSQFGN